MKKISTDSLQSAKAVIGLDLSDERSTFIVIDADSAEIVEEASVETTRAAMRKVFGGRPPARIAIEAGGHSPWVSRLLHELGHEVIVANPRQVALIARSKRKNDRLDAIALARLARFDTALLYPITHRGEQAQLDLALLRSRDFLVSQRTSSINHVRGLVKSFGERLPKCASEAFPERAAAALPEALREIVSPLLEAIAAATARIKELDHKVTQLIEERYGEASQLQQVKGVGPITSLAFVLTIEEAGRFGTSRDVPAYLGLTPGERKSGQSDPEMHITKAGDSFLRKLLIQSAHYIIGPFGEESDLRSWGLRLAGQAENVRGNKQKKSNHAKKRAVTAVARKLAVLLHYLWRTGDVYEPLRLQRDREPGRESELIAAAG